MTQHSEPRSAAYRRILSAAGNVRCDVRRAVLVRCEGDGFLGGVPTSGIAWVAALEYELVDSLAIFEEDRADGLDTRELADYIAYLSACVLRLTGGRFVESPIKAVEAVASQWKATYESDRARLRAHSLE